MLFLLEKIIYTTVPLSTTQKEQILSLRQWANIRAVSATKKDNLTQYKQDNLNLSNDEKDVSKSRGGRTLDF